jgi:GMP synthase-like glutamine amidotransferase
MNSGGNMTEQERELERLKTQIETMKQKMQRVHLICLDHATCECSAGLMIMDVLASDR